MVFRAPKKTIQGMLLKEHGAVLLSRYPPKQTALLAATRLRLPVTVYLYKECPVLNTKRNSGYTYSRSGKPVLKGWINVFKGEVGLMPAW